MVQHSKQTAQLHTAGMHNTCDLRNPSCHIEMHDSLTMADQHWLDFNLAERTFSHIQKDSDSVIFCQ